MWNEKYKNQSFYKGYLIVNYKITFLAFWEANLSIISMKSKISDSIEKIGKSKSLSCDILFLKSFLIIIRNLFWFFNNYLKFKIFIRLIISFKKFCLIELYAACGRPLFRPPACGARASHLLGSALRMNTNSHFIYVLKNNNLTLN